MLIKLQVLNLTKENAERFEKELHAFTGVRRIDTWQGRAEIDADEGLNIGTLISQLREKGFQAQLPEKTMKVCIDGMTCRSCEITIERQLKRVPGLKSVDVNAGNGTAVIRCDESCSLDIPQLQNAIHDKKYTVREWTQARVQATCEERPNLFRLIGLFALVLLLGSLLEKLGFSVAGGTVTETMSFAAAVVLGVVAGTSSCLAVSGGLLLSSMAKFNERYASATSNQRMRPALLFATGRVVAYALLGGLIGVLGQAFTFSPLVTGGLIILAAFYMLIMGLDMLKISPRWLKACMPRMPKSLSHRIVDAQGKEHWSAPFLLGAATFFLPCGFTQSLQVFALTTGSFGQSALMLGGFALGTVPALLALGFASSSLKGKAGKFFFQFSGALVVVLGIWNLQNGLALAGVTAPQITFEPAKEQAVAVNANDPNVRLVSGVQTIQMSLIDTAPYYSPSDEFTVKAGVPVRMQINGIGRGCRSALQIPKLGASVYLNKQNNVLEFTPEKAGRYVFSCGMGMYRGTLNVVAS